MQEKSGSETLEKLEETRKDRTEETGAGARPQEEAEAGLEELFARAEALIRRLENPELPLEEAFAAYGQGMEIIRQCNRKIDLVEEKMMVMNAEGALVPFETVS